LGLVGLVGLVGVGERGTDAIIHTSFMFTRLGKISSLLSLGDLSCYLTFFFFFVGSWEMEFSW